MQHTGLPTDATEIVACELAKIVGGRFVLVGEEAAAFAQGWSDLGIPIALVRPGSTEETAACLRACHAARIPVVPWGGRTGLVGGACADGAVAISLDRMNSVLEVDPVDATMIAQAGCIVEVAADAAASAGMFLPLDLGSRGSATIGGTIATNAGGNRVLRFGMMRDMVLGLEAVLVDGTVITAMRPLIKNNTAYDLKQLFIGSEGTLGIVTRAALRLRPALRSRNAALVASDTFADLVRLLRHVEAGLGGQLSAFEAMWPDFYEIATSPPARSRPILANGHGFYALVEAMGSDVDADRELFEQTLAEAMELGLVGDAVIARSEAEVSAIWALREETLLHMAPFVALDVSLRLSRIAEFMSELDTRMEGNWPGTRKAVFGHVGDGNLHLVIAAAPGLHRAIITSVFELVAQYEGSISAEHGIGLDKRDYLHFSRSPEEIEAMWAIKRALDPLNLMNPGKTLPQGAQALEGPQ
jgi:FAD/FMN-containing dehydrogenase